VDAQRPAQSSTATLPDGIGKEIVQRSCGEQCHAIDIFTGYRLSQPEWQTMVEAMVARGATGTTEEMKTVIDYLSKHFGR
jgi:cytochrome c5